MQWFSTRPRCRARRFARLAAPASFAQGIQRYAEILSRQALLDNAGVKVAVSGDAPSIRLTGDVERQDRDLLQPRRSRPPVHRCPPHGIASLVVASAMRPRCAPEGKAARRARLRAETPPV